LFPKFDSTHVAGRRIEKPKVHGEPDRLEKENEEEVFGSPGAEPRKQSQKARHKRQALMQSSRGLEEGKKTKRGKGGRRENPASPVFLKGSD